MQVILLIEQGPAAGRRFRLAGGQTARVGRTEWADFSAPADQALEDVHFELRADPAGCRVRPHGQASLLINGENADPQKDTDLYDGDCIVAGRSTFRVSVEGARAGAADRGAVEAAAADAQRKEKQQQLASPIAEGVDLSEEAQALLTDDQTTQAYVEALKTNELFDDAVRFWAACLDSRESVWWAVSCVRQVTPEPTALETSILGATSQWVNEPSEENRRAAEAATQQSEELGPASFAALSAFWSGGSLAPADLPPAPAPPGLAAQGVTGALLLAAPRGGMEQINDTLNSFLDLGAAIAEGQNLWDQSA